MTSESEEYMPISSPDITDFKRLVQSNKNVGLNDILSGGRRKKSSKKRRSSKKSQDGGKRRRSSKKESKKSSRRRRSSKSQKGGKRRRSSKKVSKKSSRRRRSSKSQEGGKKRKSRSGSRSRSHRGGKKAMNDALVEFRKVLNAVLDEMKGDGVNFPMAMKIAGVYQSKAKKDGLTGVPAAKKALEIFKNDSKANRMKIFNEVKNQPRKPRKSKKSKKSDSDSE
jgi:hypothetical protein